MKNKFSSGQRVEVTATAAVTSGQIVKVGSLVGVAVASAAIGEVYELDRYGQFDHAAEGAGAGQAWAIGDALYWDDVNKRATKTSAGNTKFAVATADKTTLATTGRLLLVPTI